MDFKNTAGDWISRKFRECGIAADVRVPRCDVFPLRRKALLEVDLSMTRAELEALVRKIQGTVS